MEGRARNLPVPDVVGLPLPIAEKVLKNAGFAGARVVYEESYEPKDRVLDQTPARGSLLEEDRPVEVRVARNSLIRYLPSVYQPREPGETTFLRDFLWIIQHLHDGVSRRLDSMHELFNPYATPPETLSWLASWFAISFDESMSEERRRRILKEAAVLYRMRGTKSAIIRMVKLFTDIDVEIEENRWPYRGLRIGVTSAIGMDTMVLPEVSMSHTFVVKVPISYEEIDESSLVRLHHVIETEKPANTNYFLQFAGKQGVTEDTGLMRVGVSSGIGLKTQENAHG
ncbi:MAG: PASTA domain-containing protein [Deltaproteobacteria bacterium]|nr:PASTA domain-containing protein [Deltaproteobacteria bacterium]